MVFVYFIRFDEEGEIGCFCKHKPKDCFENCDEYIVKLSLVRRDKSEEVVTKFVRTADDFVNQTSKLTTELQKISNKLRRGFR